MSVCKTIMFDKAVFDKQFIEMSYQSSMAQISHRIIKVINKNHPNMNIILDNTKLGSGSFGKVYEAKLIERVSSNKNKKYNVALKIIKIEKDTDKKLNEAEVVYMNKLHDIKRGDDRVSPKVFLCDFLFSNESDSSEFKGYQAIVMELKTPFSMREVNKESNKNVVEILVNALKNYELAVKNGVYLFDVKPSNNVIDPSSKNGIQIIDTDPTFMYTKKNMKGSFFEPMDKSVFERVFTTLIQLMYMVRFINLKKTYSSDTDFTKFIKIVRKHAYVIKILERYIKYIDVIYRFMKYNKFEHETDLRFRNLFFKYNLSEYRLVSSSEYAKLFNKLLMKYMNLKEVSSSSKKKTKKKMMKVRFRRGKKIQTKKIPILSKSSSDS